jgi:plasmid replication initiation protein
MADSKKKSVKKTKRTAKNQGITLIKKSNQLIEARYKFDVWETRFFLTLLSNIKREDEDFKTYRIWYRDLITTFGIKTNQSYDLLRGAAKSLMKKNFTVSSVADSGIKRDKEYHIVRTVDYMAEGEEQKSGSDNEEFIDVTFEPEMKPLLLQLKGSFTAYDLRNVVKLGTYPVRIYELLKQYESIGNRTLSFEEMKRMFELENEYPLFANFYQRIIEPSVADINEFTDLTVLQVEKIKQGRKVESLRFVFVAKSDTELRRARGEVVEAPTLFELPEIITTEEGNKEAPEKNSKDHLITLFFDEVVHKLGVTPSVFIELLDNQTEEQIRQAIRVTRRAKINNQIKTNLAGFFVQALKSGYTDPKEEEIRKKAEEDQLKSAELIKIRLTELEIERTAAINDRIRQLTKEDPSITDQAIDALYDNTLIEPILEQIKGTLGRTLTVEDFRHDKTLREMMKRTIVEMHKTEFEEIFKEFEARLGLLNTDYGI